MQTNAGCNQVRGRTNSEGSQNSQFPTNDFMHLHEAALRTLVLHMPGEVYPGPFTYKRFWVRDTAFILNAAFVRWHARSVRPIHFRTSLRAKIREVTFIRKTANGTRTVRRLWLMERFCKLTNRRPPTPMEVDDPPCCRLDPTQTHIARLTTSSQGIASGRLQCRASRSKRSLLLG